MYQNALCFVMYISEDSPLEVYKKYHEDDKEGGPFLFVGQWKCGWAIIKAISTSLWSCLH